MRSYHIHRAWQAIADRATVPYGVFRFRVADGWDAMTAATTPKRPHATVLQRVWPVIASTPGITTDALREHCPDLTAEQVYYAVRRADGLVRTLVAKGSKGARPVYALRVAAPAPAAAEPVLRRRPEGLVYGRGY
jgi:hypothetical protein